MNLIKKFLLLNIFSSMLTMPCYAQVNNNQIVIEELNPEQDSLDVGWPKDINRLIEHLNIWYKEELEAYERPELYPNFITSGETYGWIEEHKKQLKELGATVFWNKEKLKYELKKDL